MSLIRAIKDKRYQERQRNALLATKPYVITQGTCAHSHVLSKQDLCEGSNPSSRL